MNTFEILNGKELSYNNIKDVRYCMESVLMNLKNQLAVH